MKAQVLALLIATATTACSGSTSQSFPKYAPFTLSAQTSAADPLSLVFGQTATLDVTAESSYYLTTWNIETVYVPSSPLCAVAIPSAPSGTAFTYSITAQATGTVQTATYPCEQEIEFEAFPQPSATTGAATSTQNPTWSEAIWVEVEPSPTPTP